MSTESYAEWWIKVRKDFEHLRGYEEALKKVGAVKDPMLLDQIVGGLFARYSLIAQQLDSVLDQNYQVQKNETIQKLMDAAAMRVFELKNDLLQINISEYHYIDGALVELKLIPHSIEIIHPTYVYSRHHELEEFWNRIKNGETIYVPPPPPPPGEEPTEELAGGPPAPVDPLAMLMGGPKPAEPPRKSIKIVAPGEEEKKPEGEEQPKEGEEKKEEEQPEQPEPVKKKRRREKNKDKKARPKGFVIDLSEMSEEQLQALKHKERIVEALKLIQTHERGRQCRLYFNDLYVEFKDRKARAVPGAPPPTQIDPDIKLAAVLKIQAYYRGYQTRKIMKYKELERRLLIGMIHPSYKSTEVFDKLERSIEKRRAIREQHIKEYIQAHLDEKARVLRVRGPGLFEDIGDEIRWWFEDWYRNTDTFQDIPPPDKGGTILVVRGDTMTIKEYLAEQANKKKQKKKSKEQIAKEKAKAKEAKRKEKEKKKKEAALAKKLAEKMKNQPYEFSIKDTPAIEKYNEGEDELHKIWDEINDAENPLGKHYPYMIIEEKCHEMQLEVREQVDEMMRLELELLQIAKQKEAWLRKGGKGKFKPKLKKAKKKKKKGKKKGKKDPTGNRKVEDLFQELVDNKIIRTYPEAHIRDYKGDFSYQNWEKRMQYYDPPPTLGDVRSAVVINCILPLGAVKMDRPKSALIVGPRQSGKHLLANAIFNETRCVLFDLSPNVVAGKYPGAKGKKMLIHLVTKMARMLQPSVIFIDGGEKPFYKKVPKDEKEFEPKKVGKLLKPILKFITPEDKILLLGVTKQPWAAQFGGMKKTYQKIILIPRTDYGSVFLYWNELLMPYQGVDRNFDISVLAMATRNYPLSELRRVVERVLIPRRLIQLNYRPLLHAELLEELLQGEGPVTDKEYDKFAKFYRKTPLGKRRNAINVINEKLREKLAKGSAKK